MRRRIEALLVEFRVAELLAGTAESWVIVAATLIDQRFQPKLERLRPIAYANLYFALALAGFAALAARKNVGAARTLAAIGIAFAISPFVRDEWLNLPRTWPKSEPEWVVGPAIAAAVFAIAAAAVGRFDREAYGVGKGDLAWWAPRTAVVFVGIVPFAAIVTYLSPTLREYYPYDALARGGLGELLWSQLGRGLYLWAEEFFWHGLALFAIARTHGTRAAVLCTSFLYFMFHHAKPPLEMLSSYLGGLLLGIACLRAGTFWPAFIVHWPLNLFVELTAFALEGPRGPIQR